MTTPHRHHNQANLNNNNNNNNSAQRNNARSLHLQQLQTMFHPQFGSQIRTVDLRIPAIDKYAYCLCLHVKPTAIFISVFKLIRALLFISILLNTEFSVNERLDNANRSTRAAVNILTRVITASVSAVGIYAVISGRAGLLMPLYTMMLVDFFYGLPALYTGDLDASLFDAWTDQYQQAPSGHYTPFQGSNVAQQYAHFTVLVFSSIVMMVEIYFLCVIWKCYRYLRLIELIAPIRLSEIYSNMPPRGGPSDAGHHNHHPYPIVHVFGSSADDQVDLGASLAPPPYESIASNTKPPNYEEAIKSAGIIFHIDQAQLQHRNESIAPTATNQHYSVSSVDNLAPPPNYSPPPNDAQTAAGTANQLQAHHQSVAETRAASQQVAVEVKSENLNQISPCSQVVSSAATVSLNETETQHSANRPTE